ncbi:MAG: PDZ domain-containing protein [Ilumatobacteraceae bacterium]
MEGVEPNEEEYPGAPVPRHERIWRHPSEMGESMWQRTEPPLSIGRGLLVTSGAIGGLLALAVLWAMLPTNPGAGANAVTTEAALSLRASTSASVRASTTEAASELSAGGERTTIAGLTTVTRPTTTVRARVPEQPRSVDETDASGTDVSPTDEPATDASANDAPTASPTGTVAAATAGPATTAVPTTTSKPVESTQATIAVSLDSSAARSAIAVSVGNSPLVLTTASAVSPNEAVTLSYSSGQTTQAKVTMTWHGIAVLAPDNADAAAPFAPAAKPQTGDVVTLLSGAPTTASVTVAVDGSLQMDTWGTGEVTEGTPVVNSRGQLVGLCTRGGGAPKLLTVDISSLRRAVAEMSGSSSSSAWLGVQLNTDPKGSLTINYVDPHGPAAQAGVIAGDTIVAVDGATMTSSSLLLDVFAAHRPDDEIAVTIQHADGSTTTLDVVLAVAPATA